MKMSNALDILCAGTESQRGANYRMRSQTVAGSAKVLVVDDAADLALSLQYVLETLIDCEVCTAFNAEQALQLLEHKSFDVLVTDYHMPGMDGLALAEQVCRLYPRTTTIIVSADSDAIQRDQAARVSVQHILDKPAEPAQIYRLVSDALGR